MTSKVCEHCQPLRRDQRARLGPPQPSPLADINLGIALASILYFAVSLVLLTVTIWPEQHLVDGDLFHQLDFGSTFLF